jgi:hypothetical protein
VSKDTDFSQRGFLFGPPPKVVWIRLGNCSTKEIEDVLHSYSAEIRQFGLDPDSSFFPIDPIAGKNPTRILVESSAIYSISYDPKRKRLTLNLKVLVKPIATLTFRMMNIRDCWLQPQKGLI